jgi:hypothetical protein
MGAKDWMLFSVAEQTDVREVLRDAPDLDRDATRALVRRLHPGRTLTPVDDGTLADHPNPPEHHVYATCLPGLTVLCTREVALDVPSTLDERFRAEARGRTLYLHAMHSVVDWFAFGMWTPDGTLRRALSLSPEHGIIENTGEPLPFEAPYWAGENPVDDDDDEGAYPLPFHPLDLGEDALRALFGFNFEGTFDDDDPEIEDIDLAGYRLT